MTRQSPEPVKERPFIPYGRQSIDEEDIQAVVDVLRSDWLTTGPNVETFERAFAKAVGTEHAVALSNGTAALHAMMYALNIGPGDEVIVPSMTFVASANSVVYQSGTPVFCDVEPGSLLLDPEKVESLITPRTRAVMAVDYAGQPCDYEALREVTQRHGLSLVADACHSLGGAYRGRTVGSLAELNAFSFHPVKNMTTGEGGMVTTDDPDLAVKLRQFRNHGITTDHRQREERGSWEYQMVDLGYNYRITDLQCALGLSQLRRLPDWVAARQKIASAYDRSFDGMQGVKLLETSPSVEHAHHLYVVRVGGDRAKVFHHLRRSDIGVNVHYIPVHLHPFYRRFLGTTAGMCPVAEEAYKEILSLPVFPGMGGSDVERVVESVREAVG